MSNIVSLTAFEVFTKAVMWKLCDLDLKRYKVILGKRCNLNDRELGLVKVIQGQRSCCQSTAHWWLPIRHLLTSTSYLSPFLKCFTCNFNDPELEQFTVIQEQRSWCQSIVHCQFHIRLPLNLSVTVFEIFIIKAIFSKECKPKSELNRKQIDAHAR